MSGSILLIALLVAPAIAQTPLVDRRVPHNKIPYQVDTEGGIRGPQYGYNQCNATTANNESLCQTAYIDSLDDWCLWAPPEPNSVVGNVEGEMVAWCVNGTKHGTRQFPPGTIKGAHFVKTPGYVQITGTLDQTLINIQAGDGGGEMDSAGADNRGNPIGGLVYSNRFGNQTDGYTQVIHWHNFMGGNQFCFKACDPAGPNAARLCEHVYDRMGCAFNAPGNYAEGVFEECLGDDQDPVGVINNNGNPYTFYQPEGAIDYAPPVRTPSSSSCTTRASTDVFGGAPASASASASGSSSGSNSASSATITSPPVNLAVSATATPSPSSLPVTTSFSGASQLSGFAFGTLVLLVVQMLAFK